MPTYSPRELPFDAVDAQWSAIKVNKYLHRYSTRTVRFGYELGPDPMRRDTFIRPKKDTYWLICHAFFLIDVKGYSLRKALEIVTQKGLRSKQGKSLAVSTFANILTDPFYTGLVQVDGQWLPSTHEPAVSKPRFIRVQERLVSHRRSPGMKTAYEDVVQKYPLNQ